MTEIKYTKSSLKNKNLILNFEIIKGSDKEAQLKKDLEKYNEKFFVLSKFNKKTAEYSFDVEKWLEDRHVIVKGGKETEKSVSINKLPKAVSAYCNAATVGSIVEQYFYKFLKDNKELTEMIFGKIPLPNYKINYNSYTNKIRLRIDSSLYHSQLVLYKAKELKR
jgi:hypothetical protein